MKSLILLIALLLATNVCQAKWTTHWLEPSIGAAAMGYYAYYQGADMMTVGMYATAGALAGHALNYYYNAKYGEEYQRTYVNLKEIIQEMEHQNIKDLERGKLPGVIKQQVIRGHSSPDGTIYSPQTIYKLELPTSDLFMGD